MKVSIIIRFVLAVVFAALSCVGILAGTNLLVALWGIAWLLLMGRSELTKPINRPSRKELWLTIGGFVILLGLVVTLEIWHLPEPNGTVRRVLAAAMWILWMWVIYRKWQREKAKVGT